MPGTVAVPLRAHTHTWHGGCAHLRVCSALSLDRHVPRCCHAAVCSPPELSRVFVRCQELHLVACCWKTCVASAGMCQVMSCGCDRAHRSARCPGTVSVSVCRQQPSGGSQLNAPEHVGCWEVLTCWKRHAAGQVSMAGQGQAGRAPDAHNVIASQRHTAACGAGYPLVCAFDYLIRSCLVSARCVCVLCMTKAGLWVVSPLTL